MTHEFEDDLHVTHDEEFGSPRRRGGFLGKLVALLLGFILGVVAVIGGVAGVGYWALQKPVNELTNTVNGFLDPDIDFNEYLNMEKYGDATLLEFVNDVIGAAQSVANEKGTLNDFNEISPLVSSTVAKLMEKVEEFGFDIDQDRLMATEFGSMIDFFKETINNTAAGDILRSFDMSSPLLMALCYGEEGIDYTIDENGNVQMLEGSEKTLIKDFLGEDVTKLLEKVPVGSLLTDLDPDDPDDEIMFAIAYGTKGSTFDFVTDKEGNKTVAMMQVHYFYDGTQFSNYEHKTAPILVSTSVAGKSGVYELTVDTGKKDETGAAITETHYVSYDETTQTYLAYKTSDLIDPIYYKKTTFADLTQDAMAIINHLYLWEVLHVDANSHKVLINLAYGVEGEDYIIVGEGEDKEIRMIGAALPHTIGYLQEHKDDLMDSIHFTDILTPDHENGILMYIFYGKEGVHYELNEKNEVVMLQKRLGVLNSEAYNEYGEKLEEGYVLDLAAKTYTDAKGNVYKLVENDELGSVKTANGDATLYYLTYTNDEKALYGSTSMGDLSDNNNPIAKITHRLTLAEALGKDNVNENKIFKHLQNVAIGDLPDAVTALTIGEIFGDDIQYTTDGNGEKVPTGTWKYLLMVKDGEEETYAYDLPLLSSMNTLMDNMQKNVTNASLRELKTDGIITEFDDETLNKKIVTNIGGVLTIDFETDKEYIGDLTINELLNYLEAVLNATPTPTTPTFPGI